MQLAGILFLIGVAAATYLLAYELDQIDRAIDEAFADPSEGVKAGADNRRGGGPGTDLHSSHIHTRSNRTERSAS